MSSECAPSARMRQGAVRSGTRSRFNMPGSPKPASTIRHLPDFPGRVPLAVHVGELLVLLEGIHAPPSLVPVGDELVLFDQAPEGRLHQLLAFLDVMEDLLAEDEAAA